MQAATNFAPDSPLVTEILASPNHGVRTVAAPDILLLHYTGMASTEAAIALLRDPVGQVSAHYVVCEDGRVLQLVPEAARAWHAGVSSWEGHADVNSRSIGIEIANGGHDFGCPAFPDAQIEAVVALCRDILGRHPIRPDRVLAHSDVAPTRKRDPGEWFPWRRLADAGVGLWVPPAAIADGPALVLGDCCEPVAALQRDLASYGYGVSTDAAYDGLTEAAVTAFQRHFRPARCDGRADLSTVQTLAALLAARAALIAAPALG